MENLQNQDSQNINQLEPESEKSFFTRHNLCWACLLIIFMFASLVAGFTIVYEKKIKKEIERSFQSTTQTVQAVNYVQKNQAATSTDNISKTVTSTNTADGR